MNRMRTSLDHGSEDGGFCDRFAEGHFEYPIDWDSDHEQETIAVYLREISNVPMLSAAEELDLCKKIAGGADADGKACRKLIEAHLRLVVSIAKKYQINF